MGPFSISVAAVRPPDAIFAPELHDAWTEDVRNKVLLLLGRDPQFRQVDAGKRKPTDLPRIQ